MKYYMVGLLIGFLALPGYSQIPIKKAPPKSTPSRSQPQYDAYILLMVDAACRVEINGVDRGKVTAEEPTKLGVMAGDNLIQIFATEGETKKMEAVTVDRGKQKLVQIQIKALIAREQAAARKEADRAAWSEAERMGTVAGYEEYLRSFPDGLQSVEARRQIKEIPDLAAWNEAERLGTQESYKAYLESYPEGKKVSLAKREIKNIQDRMAWEDAERMGTVAGYKLYLESFPNGLFRNQIPREVFVELTQMVFVQGGTFQMGDEFGDGDSYEKPVHSVTVSDFYMSNHEVTFWEYAEYCAAKGIALPDDAGWGRGNRPVINVSWYDAVKYCNWRSEQEGLRPVYRISGNDVSADWTANGYRLPTEAEWEYAARSRGKKEKWAGTSSESSLKEYANYNKNIGKTQPVKSYRPNDLGLYDMSGNVREWCWDWFDYYASSKDARDPKGPSKGSRRVYRGGCWYNSPGFCRAAYRSNDNPAIRSHDLGFRLALSSR